MAFGDTAILDNFNRGDEGPPPSADWTDIDNGLKVVNNEVRGNVVAPNYNWSCWDTSTFGADSEAYITMTDNLTVGGRGLITRGTTLVKASIDGYLHWYDGSNEELKAYRIDNGGFTQLGAAVSWTSAAGDKLGGESIGSTIKVYVDDGGAGWSEKVSRSDAAHGSAGYIGYRMYADSRDSDDFGGGTIAVGGVANPWYQYAQEQ